MAKMKVSGRIFKAIKQLKSKSTKGDVDFEELKKILESSKEEEDLQSIIGKETKKITDPQKAFEREQEIRDLSFTAKNKTKKVQSGILMGLFGDELGQALSNRFFKEDPKEIKSAQKFFAKYKKPEQKNLKEKQTKGIENLVGRVAKQRMPMVPSQDATPKPQQISLKKGYYFDERIGAMGGIRNVRTGQFASEDEAVKKRKERSEKLTKAIGADEEPLVLLREKFDELFKSVGVETSNKTVHEKLDELIDKVESGGSGFGLGDLLGMGGGRGGRASKKGGAVRRFFGGQQGRDAKGRFTKGGGFSGGKLLAGGLGAAAGGYLAYKAVDAFRDEDLNTYDPEALKQEAIAAREAGDTEYTEALKTQIGMQKKDVALQAGAKVAAVAGAGVGAYGGVKVAQKIGKTAPAKKVTAAVAKKAAPVAKAVKNKTWDLFIKFLKKRAPKLVAKVGTRLAAAGAMATVPVAGWIGAIISLGFALSTAYDLYQLWKEFSALSDAEKEAAASGKPSKEVTDWAYSVFLGKQTIDQVPEQYREQVNDILKNPPSNWKKPGEAAGATAGAATEKPKETTQPQTVAGAAAAGIAMAAAVGGGSTPSPTGVAGAIQAAKEPAMTAGGGGGGGGAAPAAPTVTPVSSGPSRRLGPAAAKRGKVDSGAARNAALAAASKYGISGPHLAQFMAQLDHESGGFKTVEENLRYSAKRLLEIFPKYYKDPAIAAEEEYSPIAIANRVYANRMGNGPPESGDGYRYRGRGLIQLTGKDNYKRFGQLAGVDLVSNPDMAGNLGTAADIAAAFYKKNVMDKGIAGEDTAKVTKAINGGSIGLSHRESLFASYMKDPNALKAGPEAPAAVGETKEEPSLASQGQDVKVGAGGGAEVPTMAASTPTDVGGGSVAAPAPSIATSQSMAAAPATSAPAAAPAAIPSIPQPTAPAVAAVTPVQSNLGQTATAESQTLAKNTMEMQAASPPVVVNNSGGGQQQPVTPPKQNLPKASARSTDNAFNRAIARDFSHPSSFTSVGLL